MYLRLRLVYHRGQGVSALAEEVLGLTPHIDGPGRSDSEAGSAEGIEKVGVHLESTGDERSHWEHDFLNTLHTMPTKYGRHWFPSCPLPNA